MTEQQGFTPLLTGLCGDMQLKQPWSCVSSQFISQAKSDRLSGAKQWSVTSACPGLLTLQGSGSTLTKPRRPACHWELEHQGAALHPLNQPRTKAQNWQSWTHPPTTLMIRILVQNSMLCVAVSAWLVEGMERRHGLVIWHSPN